MSKISLMGDDIPQTELNPLVLLNEHLRELILIAWEHDYETQQKLLQSGSGIPLGTPYLTKSQCVSAGKSAGKCYSLLTVQLSVEKGDGVSVDELFSVELSVKRLTPKGNV